jgi:ribonucleoside-diphosphate reductase beta chain
MPVIPEIIEERKNFRPFKYPFAFEYHRAQQKVHWIPDEVVFASDIQEYRTEFSTAEKHSVATILRTFTRTENIVADYWTNVVARWFRHPEIVMMANTFASFEAIHAEAYDRLNVELGLDSKEFYLSFLEQPEMKSKLELIEAKLAVKTYEDLPLSLACFSAFTEGVSLYSSFAILLNFQRFNKLKNVANILAWSTRDESLHSMAGCRLFRELVKEMQLTQEERAVLDTQIIEVSEQIFELECANINEIFKEGEFCGLTALDMKNFIWNRIVTKLDELSVPHSMQMRSEPVSKWFNELVDGKEFVDFFETRSSMYTKGWNFSEVSW